MSGHKLDFTHKINHLSFGDLNDTKTIERNFNEKFNFELDGRNIDQAKFMGNGGQLSMFGGPSALMVNYFLEISQVDYLDQTSNGDAPLLQAYQFRSSQTIKLDMGMPAIFFRYELSPIRIQYNMTLMGINQYLVKICAIIGGIYAVSSIFESVLRNSIGILGLGSPDDLPQQNNNAGRTSVKRVVRKHVQPGQTAQQQQAYSQVSDEKNTSIEEDHVEMESYQQ